MKENLRWAFLSPGNHDGNQEGLSVESPQGDTALKLEVRVLDKPRWNAADPSLRYRGDWGFNGPFGGVSTEQLRTHEAGASVTLDFWGTRIEALFGESPKPDGLVEVFLDGKLQAQMEKSARGFVKEGLEEKAHTLQLVCRGGGFLRLREVLTRPEARSERTSTRMHLFNYWNYPGLKFGGNYVKPFLTQATDYCGEVTLHLADKEPEVYDEVISDQAPRLVEARAAAGKIASVLPVPELQVPAGTSYADFLMLLPRSLRVCYDDQRVGSQSVIWSTQGLSLEPGSFVLKGTLAGVETAVELRVVIGR